jgi:hypothetical protein
MTPTRRLVAAACIAAVGCISPESGVLDSTEGCDPDGELDPAVRRFMEASNRFGDAAAGIEGDVLTACANIARDLGAEDTWSRLEGSDQVSNAAGTGACDVATRLAEARILEAGQASASLSLVVSRGECHYDFEAQAQCEAGCALNTVCDSGTVETRCEPGELSVMCQAQCEAGSTCEGSDLPANCTGQCEATCQGQCAGSCVAEDGSVTENDPNCRGKCSSSCNGTCRGLCKVEAPEGVACGIDVRCTGECTGSYSDPVCTSEFTPPTCTVDASCYASCAAEVAANAVCDPPTIRVFVDLHVAPELQPLVATLERNLPALFQAAEQKGRVLLDAAGDLEESGIVVQDRLEDLDGASLACVASSASVLAEAVGRLDVSVQASARVKVSIETHSR